MVALIGAVIATILGIWSFGLIPNLESALVLIFVCGIFLAVNRIQENAEK